MGEEWGTARRTTTVWRDSMIGPYFSLQWSLQREVFVSRICLALIKTLHFERLWPPGEGTMAHQVYGFGPEVEPPVKPLPGSASTEVDVTGPPVATTSLK